MHNWRLLLFAFLAAFHPIASFTERNLVDGREQCCDRQQHSLFRDTRLSYGTYRLSKPAEDHHLSRGEIRQDEVRKDTVLYRPADKRLADYHSERVVRRSSPELTARLTRAEFRRVVAIDGQRRETHRITSRDIRQEISREIAREHPTRVSDIRQHDRENRESVNNRPSRDNNRFARNFNERSSISLDSQQQSRRNKNNSGENRRIQENRETRNILQRSRDEVARSDTFNDRNIRHIEGERADARRAFTAKPESRLDVNRVNQRASRDKMDGRQTFNARIDSQRRSLERSDRRISRDSERRISAVKSESRLEHDKERRSLDRTDRRISRDRVDDRRTFYSESRVNSESETRSLDPSGRRIARESMIERRPLSFRSDSSLQLINNREHRSMDRSERRNVRDQTDERRASTVRLQSRLQFDNDERRTLNNRRVSRVRADERRAFRTQPESRLEHHNGQEHRPLVRSDRSITREINTSERRKLTDSSLSRLRRERRSLDRNVDTIGNHRDISNERQRLNSRRDVVENLVERRQQGDASTLVRNLNLAIHRETRERTLSARQSTDRSLNVRLEQSANRDHNERQTRAYSREERTASATRRVESRRRMDRENVRNRDTLEMERRDRRSEDRLEFRDTRRDTNRLSRSFDDVREKEVSPIKIEYRLNKNNIEREDFRLRAATGFTRIRENFVSLREKAASDDQTMTWQFVFYTLQGIYLCIIIVQMLSENGSSQKKSRALRWWTESSQNLVKVD